MDTTTATQGGGISETAARLLATHFVGCEHEGAEVLEIATALEGGELIIEATYEHEGRYGSARFELDDAGGCTVYESASALRLLSPYLDEDASDCSTCGGSGGGLDIERSCVACRGTGRRAA